MSKSKRCIVSLIALVLCLAIATVFVFAFAGCEEESASGEIVNDGDEYELEAGVREKIKISEEPDENGIVQWEYFFKDCSKCGYDNKCEGHDMYRTSAGTVYDFYPVIIPMTLTDGNGSADINSEIQVSLVFEEEPVTYDDGEDIYFYARPAMIEIISLTGESLENASIALDPPDDVTFKLLVYFSYSYNDSNGYVHTSIYDGDDHNEDDENEGDIDDEDAGGGFKYKLGANMFLIDMSLYPSREEAYTSSVATKIYEPQLFSGDGYYVFYYTADDGEIYAFDFYTIVDSYVWGALVEGTVELR